MLRKMLAFEHWLQNKHLKRPKNCQKINLRQETQIGKREVEKNRMEGGNQHYTYRLFTMSTKTVPTLKTGNLQLVSIIDKTIGALKSQGQKMSYTG